MYDKIIFLNSKVIDNETKKAKLPNSENIDYGEIAINYKKNFETICFKNSDNKIISIPSENEITNRIKEINRTITVQKEIPSSPKNGDIWITPII